MGLEEKRLLSMHKEETLPKYTKELQEIAGCKINLEIDWDSIADSKEALMNIENQGMSTINKAITNICSYGVGKDAVKKIKKITLKNVKDGSKKKILVNNGQVRVEAAWGANDYFDWNEIVKALEDAL